MDRQNVFLKDKKHKNFFWDNLGDIKEGRGDLGEEVPVMIYRLMQYTMFDILCKEFGLGQANAYFYQAGFLAGSEMAKHNMDLHVGFSTFIFDLQLLLEEMKIGILRMEAYDSESGDIVLTIGQDLDCSGLPITFENVCNYDEGFLAGILEAYTGKKYAVREVDCWANGDRVCRFKGKVSRE